MRDMKLRRLQKLKKKDERYETMEAAELMICNRVDVGIQINILEKYIR